MGLARPVVVVGAGGAVEAARGKRGPATGEEGRALKKMVLTRRK